jgi:glycosyltransferase involved in cell wall biosynthesis
MILSILIPTLHSRASQFKTLKAEIDRQCKGLEDKVEVIISIDEKQRTTGFKRNELLRASRGKYVVFVDDDDYIYPYYVAEILKAAESNADCMAINGIMTTNGKHEKKWDIAIKNPYAEVNGVYLRYPNHITPIKREHAIKIGFPDLTFAEDYDFATRLKESGLLKTEAKITPAMYHYKYCFK